VLPDAIPADFLSWSFGKRFPSAGKGGYGTCFCSHGTNLIEHYACRGTSLKVAEKLSWLQKVDKWALAQYKLSRSQKYVMVQNFNCGQMRVSGCNGHYEFVLGAGAKAKSVTNNLPILSVLCAGFYF
jgi:hypothetical protein